MMETQTAFVLAIQLLALFSIAGALLLYLLCKIKGTRNTPNCVQGSILITSVDTALGLQLCTHLANKGCRVFAGMKDTENSLPAKLLKGWTKMRENSEVPLPGTIVLLQIDVTREDILREASDAVGAHLNSGERGIMAVINTAGCMFRGNFENQDPLQWETILKTNILGSLRVAKTFVRLLRPTRGRLIYLGNGSAGDGLVAFTTCTQAIEGCAEALRKELKPFGVNVICLDSDGVPAESLFKAPIPYTLSDDNIQQYSADILTSHSLAVIESALWEERPSDRYCLSAPISKFQVKLPCRTSFHFNNTKTSSPVTGKIIQSV